MKKSKLNIMIFSHTPGRGGPFLRGFYFAKHLTKLGHNVFYVVLSEKKPTLLPKIRKIDGVNYIMLPSFKSLPRLKDHDYLGTVIGMVINPLMTLKSLDVVHCLSSSSGITTTPILFQKAIKKISTNNQIKLVADIDDWWDENLTSLWRFFSFFERMAYRNCDIGVSASDELRERVAAHGIPREKIFYVPDAADVDTIVPMPRDRCLEELGLHDLIPQKVLVHIGRTAGTLHFLRAFRRVIDKKKNVFCLLIGTFDAHELDAIDTLGLKKNIIFLGTQPYSRISRFCSAADLLVFPMVNNIFEVSRSPLTLGDYLASGRPIISNAVGETKRVLAESGSAVLCEVTDELAFAEGMISTLEDHMLRRELGHNGRRFAEEKFSWQVMAKRLETIYNS